MGTPTQKRTKASKKRRASQFALNKANHMKCSNCEKPVMPHMVCDNCGFYKGKEVVKKKTKLDKNKK